MNASEAEYRIEMDDRDADMMQAALDEHYDQYPETRPSLADIAIAGAEIDGNPLAADPERIRRAAAEMAKAHLCPDPDDVLRWAEAHPDN
jgi:hypothetical protein